MRFGNIDHVSDNRKKDAIGAGDKDMSIGFFGAGAIVVAVCVGGILLTVMFTRKK